MFFFFKDTATTEIYTYGHTLSLHDALPICEAIRQNLVARDFGAHKGRRTEVEVIADGGAEGRVVEAGAGHITTAHFGAGFTAIGGHGGDSNDGREESGCHCELLHDIFLFLVRNHALWVAARALKWRSRLSLQ